MSTTEEAKVTLRQIGAAPEAPFDIGEAALALAPMSDVPEPTLDGFNVSGALEIHYEIR